jgi:hypothetical protein
LWTWHHNPNASSSDQKTFRPFLALRFGRGMLIQERRDFRPDLLLVPQHHVASVFNRHQLGARLEPTPTRGAHPGQAKVSPD